MNVAGARHRLLALGIPFLASGVAMLLQNFVRGTWQVRTLPERVMEWLLLFIPLELFEGGLQRLGAGAKEVALAGTVLGMAATLAVIGALALRAGWESWRLLGVGLAGWLFAMAVVMPITGGGFFGTGLLISPLLTSSAYLLVFLAYASVLVAGRVVLSPRTRRRHRASTAERRVRALEQRGRAADRRALLTGVVGMLVTGGFARIAGRDGGLVASSLPLASAPTRLPATPTLPPITTAPTPVATDVTIPRATDVVAAVPPAPTSAAPTPEAFPDPPLARTIARDQGGSLTAAGRPKGQLATPITANQDFYIVTKNAVADPMIDAASWRLVIDGEVNQPVQIDYRTLTALPAVEVTKTLECISNFTAGCNLTSFGCDLISTAVWKGVRLSDLLGLAGGLKGSATSLAILASDEFSAGLPAEVVDDPETLVVYEMNGEPLPREHGFPARLLVPGRYGMKNPKWLAGIRASNQEFQGWYEQRKWDKLGVVKTMARIDVPVDGATLAAGDQRVAGIAYAGDRGLKQVDVSIDDGATWQATRLLDPPAGKDALVRWEGTFLVPTRGDVTITVRATDGTGVAQTDDFQLPQPDGASGRDQVTVSAA